MLEIEGVRSGYKAAPVLHGVSLRAEASKVTCIIGPNGAGKTTLARTVSGTVRCWQGRVIFDGQDITNARAEAIVKRGLVQVFERRELFPRLSVRQNLLLGAFAKHRALGRRGREQGVGFVHALFPRLAERSHQAAGTLSGGEQQMLAIGRALMAQPRLLLLDEPSLGLAPVLIDTIYGVLRHLRDEGLTIVLIEEDPKRALELADHGYVVVAGEVVAAGSAAELRQAGDIELAYLGKVRP